MDQFPAGWLAYDATQPDRAGQIYRGLRERILSGDLQGGARLPSSRRVAETLGCARATVSAVYERLWAEGFLVARAGSGTRVALLPPVAFTSAPATPIVEPQPSPRVWLRPGLPDLDAFPHRAWARCLAGRARSLRLHDLGYGEGGGLLSLRKAILDHARTTRGVVGEPDQVLVLPSSRAAVALLSKHLVTTPGVHAWIEEPGYPAAGDIIGNAGARLVPVPVDAEGMDVPDGLPPPRMIYVTPSHQYPTGATMSLRRRLALIETARRTGAVIIEDDYDSEFLSGRPIASMQSIDRAGVVAYVGTFSKLLAPGLRSAYVIVPKSLVGGISAQQALSGAFVPIHVQAALVDFMTEGHLRAHVRRMQARYRDDAAALVTALQRHCDHVLSIGEQRSGLQLAVWFRDREVDDETIARSLEAFGFGPDPLSRLYRATARSGLLIGIPQAHSQADAFAIHLAQEVERVLATRPRAAGPIRPHRRRGRS